MLSQDPTDHTDMWWPTVAAMFILALIAVATRANRARSTAGSSRRRTSADKTRARMVESFAAFHSLRTLSPSSAIDWINSLAATSSRRTKGINCRTPNCSDDSCCQREQQADTVRLYLRLLKTSAAFCHARTTIEHPLVKRHLEELYAVQTEAGRVATPAPPLFLHDAIEICIAAEQNIDALIEVDDIYGAIVAQQCLTATTLDLHCWRRAGDLTHIRYDRLCISSTPGPDGNPVRYLHVGLLHQKVMACGNGRYTTARERPGCPTCPIRQIERTTALYERYDFPVGDGIRFLPEVSRIRNAAGTYGMVTERTEHKRACPHSYPTEQRDDCHPECNSWLFPAVTTATINRHLRRWCVDACVSTEYSAHSMRSAPVLLMLANGTSVQNINTLMGWSADSSMWKTYARQAQFQAVHVQRTIHPEQIQAVIDTARQAVPIFSEHMV